MRFGSYPTSTLGTNFLGKELGMHGYNYRWSEKDGIAYACRGGHIDVIHVRIAADWAAYLAAKSFRHLMRHDSEFSYPFNVESSTYFVQLSYPGNWESLAEDQRESIARDVSIRLGEYLAYTTTTWHEILTWFGFKCLVFFPEFPSAFSWEDSYSNLLGARIGAEALRDTEHSYDQAVSLLIDREMEKLGIQSAEVARAASEKVKGTWFTGAMLFLVDMRKRNFDIGVDDGYSTPTLVPGIGECEGAEPQSYPAPSLDFLSQYGFSMKLEIEPRVWESGKILSVAYADSKTRGQRIEPAIHFGVIMDWIKKDAVRRYGSDAASGSLK